MFYYYQIRNHHYKTEAVPNVSCPLCQASGHLHMSILQKYTWMAGPMAPSSKYAIAWCENCDKYIPKVKWTDEMDTAYVQLKQGLKTPARLYRGLWVMPLLIVALIGSVLLFVKISSGRQKKNQNFVLDATLQPRPGDIFQINHSIGQSTYYTYYKVVRASTDSVYIQEAVDQPADIKAWDNIPTEAAAYEPEQIAFSLAKIKSMDGMFSREEDGTPVYGLVWGVWRDGELHKKY